MRLCLQPTLTTLNLNFMGISQQELLSLVGVGNLSLSSVYLKLNTLGPEFKLQENLSFLNNASRLSILSVVLGDLPISQAIWNLARASASTLKTLKWMSSPYYREFYVLTYEIDGLLKK